MSEYIPIPGYDDYSVSALGIVRSERSGRILTFDAQGKVQLRTAGKHVKAHVGPLMALAGLVRSGEDRADSESVREEAQDALARLSLVERECDGLRSSLDKARKANDLLLGIRSSQARRIDELEKAASGQAQRAKHGRKAKSKDPVEPDCESLDDF
jgi:BMFP domain-containing protein YqiC